MSAPGRRILEMKLENRTVVIWDTGERRACEQTGEAIITAAASPVAGDTIAA